MEPRKYQMPQFVEQFHTQQKYDIWLSRKASILVKRDKKRGNLTTIREKYKMAIHSAVVDCGACDHYTGEPLDWKLLGMWNNAESKAGRRKYKKDFALLPTVDHVGDGLGEADFKICAWRTNDAKNDLTHEEFVELCRRVVAHFDRPAVRSKTA
jgi:hypothetical protein